MSRNRTKYLQAVDGFYNLIVLLGLLGIVGRITSMDYDESFIRRHTGYEP